MYSDFKLNPTFKLSIPLGANGCKAIQNATNTNIVHIKNYFDYDGFKALNHTVFDMKEICQYSNYFQNGLYDLKAIPNYEYHWTDFFTNNSNKFTFYPEINLRKNESATKIYESFEDGLKDNFTLHDQNS